MLALDNYRVRLPFEVALDIERLAPAPTTSDADPEVLLDRSPSGDALTAFGAELLNRIRTDGLVLVRASELDPRLWRLGFAALGLTIADPILRYGLLYSVHDRGGSFEESAIPVSMTRAATGLHTDSSAWNCIPGIVGLLCERPSLDGGASQVADARAACEWLREVDLSAFESLRKPYLRDVVTPGVDRSPEARRRNRFPILELEPTFQLRYMRYWIEKGHERLAEPLDADALRSLDALDAALLRPEWSLRFQLAEGDFVLIDNRRLVHGREAYDNVPAGGRLLWRLWLDERWRASDAAARLAKSSQTPE